MASLAALSGVLAFIDRPPPGRAPMVVCPTICFTFAILLCWGLGPAIAAQVVAVAFVAWRMRRPVREAVEVAGNYTLAMAAAALVLWVGDPDPFQRDGPTNLVTDAVTIVVACLTWLAVYGALTACLSMAAGATAGPRAPRWRRSATRSCSRPHCCCSARCSRSRRTSTSGSCRWSSCRSTPSSGWPACRPSATGPPAWTR